MERKLYYDADLFHNACKKNLFMRDLHYCEKFLKAIQKLLWLPLTEYQVVMLQKIATIIFQETAFILRIICRYSKVGNKLMYKADTVSWQMLKSAAKFGFDSDEEYITIYYNKTFRYTEAVSSVKMTRNNLAQPYLMYRGSANSWTYIEARGMKSWSYKIRML